MLAPFGFLNWYQDDGQRFSIINDLESLMLNIYRCIHVGPDGITHDSICQSASGLIASV